MIKECAEELTMAEIGLYQFVLCQKYPLYYENTTIPAEDFIQYLYKLSGKSNDEFIRKTADKLLEKLKSEIEGEKK